MLRQCQRLESEIWIVNNLARTFLWCLSSEIFKMSVNGYFHTFICHDLGKIVLTFVAFEIFFEFLISEGKFLLGI